MNKAKSHLEDIQDILPGEIAAEFSSCNRVKGHIQSRISDFLMLNTVLITDVMNLPAFLNKKGNQKEVEGHMTDGSSSCKDYFFHASSFSSSRVARKRSPRTSKLTYISQLALAGLSRTISPAWASSKALRVASEMFAAST